MGPGQPPPQRRLAASQLPRRLQLRHPLQVAQDHRPAHGLRQPRDLLVQLRIPAIPRCAVSSCDRIHLNTPTFSRPESRGIDVGPDSNAVGHTVQPTSQRALDPERANPADQDEEGGLESVLNVDRVAEHTSADGQDHRAVPGDQRRESVLVSVAREPIEERAHRRAPRRTRRSRDAGSVVGRCPVARWPRSDSS